ncbi:hypothetical protein NKH57_14005 [Mesorhizobium sp. M1050]|uniref:hypothetical protein n=1 Tax=Mesorhizobium sp. M1050 TaxID=2957051 RepID=UPI003339189D
MLISATNLRHINADDELFARISGKLHLKLASVIRLGSRAPSFLHHLIVEPLADPDGTLAHGRMRLSRFSGQEIGQHLRRLPVRAACFLAARRQFHQLRYGSIGTNFLQPREGTDHPWMAFPAQHPSGIKLNGAKDGSDPACRVVLDLSERMAIRANPAKKAYVSAS